MYVRSATEIPDERRAFQSPAIPDAVVADVAIAVEGQRASVEPALRLQAIGDFVSIALAIRLDEDLQHLLDFFALIGRQFSYGDAREASLGTTEADGGFVGQLFDQRDAARCFSSIIW